MIALDEGQLEAVEKLRKGSILCGAVGSGKTRTALAYYLKVCEGSVNINGASEFSLMKKPKDLYIITTAKKRDSMDWQSSCTYFAFTLNPVTITVDSWNNIKKYKDIENAFFIFDEQRLIGSGIWVKSFLKITRQKQQNHWLLLSATPGDTWIDYIPVFIANGFYPTRSDFKQRHCLYNTFSKYPKLEGYVGVHRLEELRDSILVPIKYKKHTVPHIVSIIVPYDEAMYSVVEKDRWNPLTDEPIESLASVCYLLRYASNRNIARLYELKKVLDKHHRVIVFYNFDYELDFIKDHADMFAAEIKEYNGHKHEPLPESERWLYLNNYISAAEAWECTETNCIFFFSQNYSFRVITQCSGRIDRRNTPFTDLYYYHIRSNSKIDKAMLHCYNTKEIFNEKIFEQLGLAQKT